MNNSAQKWVRIIKSVKKLELRVKQVLILSMNQKSKRLTRKVVQVFNGLNNSNPFLGTVEYC